MDARRTSIVQGPTINGLVGLRMPRQWRAAIWGTVYVSCPWQTDARRRCTARGQLGKKVNCPPPLFGNALASSTLPLSRHRRRAALFRPPQDELVEHRADLRPPRPAAGNRRARASRSCWRAASPTCRRSRSSCRNSTDRRPAARRRRCGSAPWCARPRRNGRPAAPRRWRRSRSRRRRPASRRRARRPICSVSRSVMSFS